MGGKQGVTALSPFERYIIYEFPERCESWDHCLKI